MIAITDSVGRGGKNRPVDVMIVQHLLNSRAGEGGVPHFELTGAVDGRLVEAIEAVQRDVVRLATPDARIDPGGKTLAALTAALPGASTHAVLRSLVAGTNDTSFARAGELSSLVGTVDGARFL